MKRTLKSPKALAALLAVGGLTLSSLIGTPAAFAYTNSVPSSSTWQAYAYNFTTGNEPFSGGGYNQYVGPVTLPVSSVVQNGTTYPTDPAFVYQFSSPVNIYGWNVPYSVTGNSYSMPLQITFENSGNTELTSSYNLTNNIQTVSGVSQLSLDFTGNSTNGYSFTVDAPTIYVSTYAPSAPTIVSVNNQTVNLSWPAVTGASSYNILVDGTQVATSTQTSATLTGLSLGTHNITLEAVNDNGPSPQSSATSVTISSMSPTMSLNASVLASITSGTLSLTAPTVASPFAPLVLNGLVQQDFATLSNWGVIDATGTGDGWNVQLSATQLTEVAPSSGFATGTSAKTLPQGSLSLSGNASILAQSTSTAVSASGGPLLTNTTSAIDVGSPIDIIQTQANFGMGSYTVEEPSNSLLLTLQPNSTQVDDVNYPNQPTPYSTTLTYTVVSGP